MGDHPAQEEEDESLRVLGTRRAGAHSIIVFVLVFGLVSLFWMDEGHGKGVLGRVREKRKRQRRRPKNKRNWAVHGPGVGAEKKRASGIFGAMLDDLMGPERNEAESSLARRKQLWDKDVDKYFLAGLSPYEVLRGTNKDAPIVLPGIEESDDESWVAILRGGSEGSVDSKETSLKN
eukprot:jgi/Bigna1/144581/aug1.89_g19289